MVFKPTFALLAARRSQGGDALFFFSSRRRHTRCLSDWSSDVCSSDLVTTSLKKGQRVSLVNFGTFTVAKRKARLGRNPRTGEALRIPAAKVPKFSAGKILKSAVR